MLDIPQYVYNVSFYPLAVADFARISVDMIQKGLNPNLYQGAASKCMHCVYLVSAYRYMFIYLLPLSVLAMALFPVDYYH